MIKFIVGGKNDVVPREWLANENSRCSWPEKNFKGDIATMVKNQLQPKPSWKTYKCQILCHSGEFFFSKLNLN